MLSSNYFLNQLEQYKLYISIQILFLIFSFLRTLQSDCNLYADEINNTIKSELNIYSNGNNNYYISELV